MNANNIAKVAFNIAVLNKCYDTAEAIANCNIYRGNYFELVVSADDEIKAPKLLYTLIRRLRKHERFC
jgi:hypothetical protein